MGVKESLAALLVLLLHLDVYRLAAMGANEGNLIFRSIE